MHHNNIKLIVRKQLKNQFPNWKRLPKNRKRELARKVLAEVVAEYDFKQAVGAPIEELLAIDTQLPSKGIISLDKMARIIDIANNNKIYSLCKYKRSATYLEDKELQIIDNLIDRIGGEQMLGNLQKLSAIAAAATIETGAPSLVFAGMAVAAGGLNTSLYSSNPYRDTVQSAVTMALGTNNPGADMIFDEMINQVNSMDGQSNCGN